MTAIHFPNLKQTEARLQFILKIIMKWMAVIRSGLAGRCTRSAGTDGISKHSNTTINSIEIPFSGCLQIIRNNNVHNLTPGMAMILPEGEENRLTTPDASLDKFAFGLKGSLAAPLNLFPVR